MQKLYGQLGERFINLGLITPEDVERALAHQREKGGYFGDALVSLGLLTADQVRWGLADQYDIPFVQIRAENIDRSVALCVPAAWAREHQVLPVLRFGDSVTVIIADPARVERLDEVRAFTRAQRVEAALATEQTLRELIDAVYGEGEGPPVALGDWMRDALAAGTSRIGISVRGGVARAWAHHAGITHRRLKDGWEAEFASIVPSAMATDGRLNCSPGILTVDLESWRVRQTVLGSGRNIEWSAQLEALLPPPFPHVPSDPALAEALAATGGENALVLRVGLIDHRFSAIADTLLAALPAGIDGVGPRSLHICDAPAAAPPAALVIQIAPDALRTTLEQVTPLSFDSLTLDMEQVGSEHLRLARQVAPLVVYRARSDAGAAPDADLVLCLRADGDTPFWSAAAVNDATD